MTEFAHPSVSAPAANLRLVSEQVPAGRAYPNHSASSARALSALELLFRAADAILDKALGIAPADHSQPRADHRPKLRLVSSRTTDRR